MIVLIIFDKIFVCVCKINTIIQLIILDEASVYFVATFAHCFPKQTE